MVFKAIGIIAAFLTSTGFIPQIIKTLRIKETRDLSLMMPLIIALGTFLWTIYGISIRDVIIITANVFTCSTAVALIILKIIYNGNGTAKKDG
jgi:MtN3 and saliva related transmembrane protein